MVGRSLTNSSWTGSWSLNLFIQSKICRLFHSSKINWFLSIILTIMIFFYDICIRVTFICAKWNGITIRCRGDDHLNSNNTELDNPYSFNVIQSKYFWWDMLIPSSNFIFISVLEFGLKAEIIVINNLKKEHLHFHLNRFYCIPLKKLNVFKHLTS